MKLPPLSRVTAPTLVIAGEDDPGFKPSAGRDTARRIPGAVFVSYPGMGHDLPEGLWLDVAKKIKEVSAAAGPSQSLGSPSDSKLLQQ